MHITFVFSFLLICTSFFTANSVVSAKELENHNPSSCALDGIALGGHDVVAYHVVNEAVLGDPNIIVEHETLIYQFSSDENKQLFELEPVKYLPHFQGWCAIALTRNRLTCPDYKNFKVEDGRLLLFETITFFNGQDLWNSNPAKNLISAERNFEKLVEE